MYRILVPVDSEEGSGERSVDALLAMPGVEEFSVTLLHVFEEFEAFDDGGGGTISSDSFYDPSDVPDTVRAAESKLTEAGVDCEVRMEHGKPGETIIQVVEELDADQVVMSGRKRTPVGKVLFGSVTQAIVLNAGVPVTVV
jgi:nucleotide-binding universal stress UspA family protein